MAQEELDFSQLLDEHDIEFPKEGDIRTGVVVQQTEREIIIDLGLKQDGVLPAAEVTKLTEEERKSYSVGSEITIFVLEIHNKEGLKVSLQQAKLNQDWIDTEKMMDTGEIIEVTVSGYNRGGAIAPYGQIRGFIPASQLTPLSRGMDDQQRQRVLSKMRDETIMVKVIEVDRQRRRLVFSQRAAAKEWEEKQRRELLSTLKEGDTLTGKITSLRDFGAFIDIGGVDGLIHISELAWHRVNHPREVVKVGDDLEVEILKIDQQAKRIALSRRKLVANPWTTIEDNYRENDLVEGKIVRIMDYGAFIQIEPGVEGLLHISQISEAQVKHPKDVVRLHEKHLLRIINIDKGRQRIGLSLKAVRMQEQLDWMAQQQIGDEGDEKADLAEIESFTSTPEAVPDNAGINEEE